jgi:hypothetical protein
MAHLNQSAASSLAIFLLYYSSIIGYGNKCGLDSGMTDED